MNPVERAGPVPEISPHSYFLCRNFEFCPECISTSKVFELALFVSKVTRVDKATIVANDTCFCGAILALFLEFHLGHRLKFPI